MHDRAMSWAALRHVAGAVLSGVSLLLLPLLLCLLAHSATWRGRAFAVGSILLLADACLLLVTWRPWGQWARRWRAACGLVALSGGALVLSVVILAPPGRGGDEGILVSHASCRPESMFSRYGLGNVLPEVDQVMVGLDVARAADRYIDGAQVRRLRGLVAPVYEAMGNDPAFRSIGSVMSYAYAGSVRPAAGAGHYVAIMPRWSGRPRRTMLFLHGSAGSFSMYWYMLSELARSHALAVICPTFGFGDWQAPGGVQAAVDACTDACRRFSLDPDQVFLAALSNGGRGVTRLVAEHPGRFQAAVLISAVLERAPIEEGIAAEAWAGLPVLWIHGGRDDRLPFEEMADLVSLIEAAGARVVRCPFPEEDHFLLLSQRPAVMQTITTWSAVLGAAAP